MDANYDLWGKTIRLLDGTQRELGSLSEEVLQLRKTVERQAATIAWLKEEKARQERNHDSVWEHVQEEFARAFLWLDALGCRVLPKAVMLANELADKMGAATIVPPHRLRGRKAGKAS